LVQNIGWFIGVFCFIAGSLFLVHSTDGYNSNLIAFFAFFIFTLALLFSGYRLRHKRPELEISSYVIFILSLLLIPLTTIIATQLLMSSDTLGLQLFSGLLVLIELSVFYFAVTLVSGLMDRSLQRGLPRFFLALTATQLLQVLLLALPFWQLLIVIHLLIFALLSTSIYLFANQWLQSIFIDRHKIAYFAAGTLIYAAIVAFVFITGSNAIELPAGYYGFFLLLLCGLLFFIDAQLKHWIEQHTYLSRFSFLVYGLSVLALCLVAKHPIAIPTLVLAIALYAFMVWRYLTLTPLTMLLACYFWLYHELVLQHLGYSWYLLASLPVLFSLYKAANWAIIKRQSAYLAVIVYRVLYGLLTVLTVWSLSQSEAGFVAMLTAITAGILIYYTLKSAPIAIFKPYSKIDPVSINRHENLLGSHWFYSIPLLGMVTVFYTPRLLASEVQFSLGVLLLAGFWAYYGLSSFFKARSSSVTTSIEQRLNSALFSVLVAIVPLWILSDNLQRVIPLFLAGIIILWLSYQLLMRGLFYVALLVLVTAYLPIKAIYFPTPSGLATVLISIGLWFWLWYRERQATSELILLKREQVGQKLALLPSCRLVGWYPLPSAPTLFREVIAVPLEQVMCLLWFLGMKTLYDRFYYDQLSYAWLAAVFFIAVFSLLLIIRYSLLKLLPVPIALALAAVLMMLQFWELPLRCLLLAAVVFALVSWQIVNYSLAKAFFIKLIDTLNPTLSNNDIEQAGKITHHTAFFIVIVSAVWQGLASCHCSLIALFTFITTSAFLWLSDRRYNQLVVRYLVLVFAVFAAFTGIDYVSLTLINFDMNPFIVISLVISALSIPTTTYTKPCSETAIFLVFFGVIFQLLHIVQVTAIIKPLDYTVLLLAGVSLLVANAKDKSPVCTFSAFALWVLAALWLENSLVHAQQPFYLWLNSPFADLWLLLAVLSLGISLLSHWLKSEKTIDACYLPPLNTVAILCFMWSLLGTLTLFFSSAGHANLLALIFLVLLLALFPLSKNRSGAAQSRGFASANLVTLAAFNILPIGLDGFALQSTMVLFGYTLWLVATLLLPRFNQRYSEWAIEPNYFPWLGLLLVAFSGGWWQTLVALDMGIYCLELFGYCLLMLRYSNWAGFAWLSAIAFTVVGIAFNFDNDSLPINLLLWGNLQLLLVTVWQRKGEKLAERWQWQQPPLAQAFTYTTQFIFISYLLIATLVLGFALFDGVEGNTNLLKVLPISILLVLSLLHLLWVRFASVALHSFIHSLFLLLWVIYFTYLNELFQPPLLLALWGIVLLAVSKVRMTYHAGEINTALTYWLRASVILATLALLTYSEDTLGELILSLAIVAALSAMLGGKKTHSPWLLMARFEGLLLLHGWVFLLVGHTSQSLALLLPWYALQNTLLAVLSMWFLNRLLTKPLASEYQTYYQQALQGTSWLIALGLLQLLGHGILVQQAIMAGLQPQWLLSPFDSIAAFSTGAIIVTVGLRRVRHSLDSNWLYGLVMLVGALAFYGRLLWLGAAAVSLWDTAALIGCAYILFFLQGLFPSKPLYNTALLMPVLALFTVPLQLASPETSITLMATGVLYALVRRHNQQKIPLYLALLAFNAGVYLWIPSLVDSSELIQIYVIPAALSSLMLLHLHSRELKPSVLMGSRLAAISSIYACATVDVFLRAELGVFILAMGLSVVGILLGIALRTRAFLYAGLSFLLLNVIGQALRFYPKKGLESLDIAIVLLVMGATILGFMFWFNEKKVAILQRINSIQAQMQTWE
jgi:hypothetical protein